MASTVGFFPMGAVVMLMTAPPAVRNVSVILTPATPEIRVSDPLYVQVLVFNERAGAVTVDPILGTAFGTLRVEIRPEDGGDFELLSTPLQARLQPEVEAPVRIDPGTGYAAYELFFQREAKPQFPKPGRFQLRAVVTLGDRSRPALRERLFSPPVTITVTDRAAAEQRLIADSAPELSGILSVIDGPSGTAKLETIQAIERQLGESNLKRTLQWVSAILRLRQAAAAEDAREAERARLTVDRLRGEQDPVMHETIGIVLAYEYLNRYEWSKAQAVLRTLHFCSWHSDAMSREVSAQLAESRSAEPAKE